MKLENDGQLVWTWFDAQNFMTGIICMGAGTLFGITANRIFRLSFTAPELPEDGVVIMLGVLECLTWSVTTFRLS